MPQCYVENNTGKNRAAMYSEKIDVALVKEFRM